LNAALTLKRSPVDITLVDRRNFHLFQPLLYQVATGSLSPANIAYPLRAIVRRQRNCRVILGDVRGFDVTNHKVLLEEGSLEYDTLVVAAGAGQSYFGHPEWERLAPGLKSIEDSTEIRRRILASFEAAEREDDPEKRRAWLNFVVVGGGPTGVELAGALAEIARHSLKSDFRRIDTARAEILLVEGEDRVLMPYPPDLSEKAKQSLERLGVTVRTNTIVADIAEDHVQLKTKSGVEPFPTRTVLWAAGVQASPLAKLLAEATGAELDRAGHISVEPDLSLPGHPEIFVLGDMAKYTHQGGKPLPGVAPVAIQEGKFVARLIDAHVRERPLPKFHYHDLGNLATIGRAAAVADFGRLTFSGFIAWVLWLFIHLMNLVSFRNRLLVFTQWAWSYITYDRAARLITETPLSEQDENENT